MFLSARLRNKYVDSGFLSIRRLAIFVSLVSTTERRRGLVDRGQSVHAATLLLAMRARDGGIIHLCKLQE
jgi:hypothetical protein